MIADDKDCRLRERSGSARGFENTRHVAVQLFQHRERLPGKRPVVVLEMIKIEKMYEHQARALLFDQIFTEARAHIIMLIRIGLRIKKGVARGRFLYDAAR